MTMNAGTRRLGGNLVRILLVGFFAFPLLFMFMSSLKPDDQIFADLDSIKAFLPVGDISLANYTGVFQTVPAGRFLLNSIGITTVTVLIGLVVNSMAAFALSRMRWRGQAIVLAAVIATLVVPFETFALPLLWWVNKLPWALFQDGQFFYTTGWLDTYRVQIFPFLANAFSIYLFYSYFQSIPTTLDEAARVDGAGWFRIYRKVVMPLAGPAIATVAILTFLPAWNSFLWPLMVVQTESLRPVMVGISYFQQLKVLWGQIMAYSVLITIPVLMMFLALQRQFIRSIASAGVKG
jgi:multiple sugar transport system permease protein